MSRIPLTSPERATGDLKASFDAVRASLGTVPNGVKALGASPQTLAGYLQFSGSLTAGSLSRAERERVAVLTAQRNECGYCLSGHTLAGRAAGLDEGELAASRRAESGEARAAALLAFADAVIDHRGDVPDRVLTSAREAGLSDGELIEVVAAVALNTFTNYSNRLARPEYDFPRVPLTLERDAA
jgi:uncharacterized peroxidase-related enzyme